jgi:PAS domain S-box-containing protein
MPRRDEAGVLTGFMAIESDITEQKRAAAKLAASESKVRAIIDASPVPMAINEQDRITFVNPAFTRTFGYELTDIPTLAEWWPKAYPDGSYRASVAQSWKTELERSARAGDAFTPMELRVRAKNGVEIVALVGADPIVTALKESVLVSLFDITARKKAEVELKEVSDRLQLATRAGGVGTWEYRVADNKVTWDDQMFQLYGIARGQFGGAYEAWRAGVHPEDQARCDHEIQLALSGEKDFDTEFRVLWPDGTTRHIRGMATVQRDSAGQPVCMVGTNWDVTERKHNELQIQDTNCRLAAALQAAEAGSRAKSAFLANMSHEIRTPLTAILGYADVLREDGDLEHAPQHRLQTIDTIRNAGQHLLVVINDILDLSKIEADRMTVEKIETPVTGILREVESLMRPRAAGKGLTLSASLVSPIPERIVSDPTRLRQILMNLTGNAVKFTEHGNVTIRARAAQRDGHSRLVIDVEDSGPGMTPEQAGKLFQAFGQADETVTRKHGGTGLGLTISRRLAGLMGGKVTLERTAPGQGSCFRLDLPLDTAPGSAMVETLAAVEDAHGPSRAQATTTLTGRILLAEDGLDNQRLISFHLRKAGAQVTVADNGRIALEMIEKAAADGTAFDLLLTDMQMPEMDGYTLARTLRSRGSTLAVVALTAHAMAEDRTKCTDAGCDDYATKPVDKAALLATCAKWMGKAGGVSTRAQAA